MDSRPTSAQSLPANALVGLYGAGGFAREVMPLLAHIQLNNPGMQRCFIETTPKTDSINGCPLISEAAFLGATDRPRYFNVAIADSRHRQRLATICMQRGALPLTLVSPQTVIYDNNLIGEGAILCAHTTVTSNARIGRFFHANLYSYVAHDCVIGDFVTFAPNVQCNGCVHVGDHAYVGTGAILKPGSLDKPLVIGEGAIVGMGAVVTRDVPPHTTVVGNPARPLERP